MEAAARQWQVPRTPVKHAPFVIREARWGIGLGQGKLEDALMQGLLDTQCGLYMANTAELYSEQQGITREQMDEFALRSQKCADDAYKAGRLQEELTSVALKNKKGEPTGEPRIDPKTEPKIEVKGDPKNMDKYIADLGSREAKVRNEAAAALESRG